MDDIKCGKCYDFGEIVICGWCESNSPHSSCDDTFVYYCECEAGKQLEAERKNQPSYSQQKEE